MKLTCGVVIAALLLTSCTSCPKVTDIGINSAPQEETTYFLQVKGAEAAGVQPDDVKLVAKFYQDVVDARAMGEFVHEVATGDFGNDSYGWDKLVTSIPRSTHVKKNHLKTPLYARFGGQGTDAGLRMTLSDNQQILASAKELNGDIFKVTDTRWTKQKSKVSLALFVRPAPVR